MTTQITIDPRHCGPPQSGNGGYTCGLTARALAPGTCEVTLVSPPPLGRPLDLTVDGDEARLVDGGTVVAVARRASPVIEVPAAPTYDDAVACARDFDLAAYARTHPYPTCFTCGPGRAPGDGLRIFAAPSARPGLCLWPWVPNGSLSGGDGLVEEPVVWAALDCPSGLAWIRRQPDLAGIVLGRMATVLHRRPRVRERLVVGAWTIDRQARKLHAAAALWSERGDTLARSRTTWIVLTEEQRAAFAAAGR